MYQIQQKTEEMYSKKFDIINHSGYVQGKIDMKCSLLSPEATFVIATTEEQAVMSPCKKALAKEIAGENVSTKISQPYSIKQIDREHVIFTDYIKHSLFNDSGYYFISSDYGPCYFYFVGFGDKGIHSPLYNNDTLIGEIHKPCIVHDGLHIFDVDIHDSRFLMTAIAVCCRMYRMAYYEPGVKKMPGYINKKFITTTDEYLLSKCPRRY